MCIGECWHHLHACCLQVNTKAGKWGIFILAFTTTLREGLEAVVFIAGVSASLPVSSIPIPAVVGIIMGITVGVILYYTWVQRASRLHSVKCILYCPNHMVKSLLTVLFNSGCFYILHIYTAHLSMRYGLHASDDMSVHLGHMAFGLMSRGKKITDIAWFIYIMTGFLFLIAAGELLAGVPHAAVLAQHAFLQYLIQL